MSRIGLKGLWVLQKQQQNLTKLTTQTLVTWSDIYFEGKLVHLRAEQHAQFTARTASTEINKIYCFTCE